MFSDIFIVGTAFLIFYSIFLYQRKWIKLLRFAFTLPGPYALPFFGNALNFACKPEGKRKFFNYLNLDFNNKLNNEIKFKIKT